MGATGRGKARRRVPRRGGDVRPQSDAPRARADKVARARSLFQALAARYPDAHCELLWSEPHELLVATILSAQCTDVAVNKATPALFRRFPTPGDFARATPAEIEPYVRSLGFFRTKSKHIHECMRAVVDRFGGRVPDSMQDLLTLKGVARKTANVVLGNAFSRNEGIVVDTHVLRLAKRFGLSRHSDPVKVERDLMALFPRHDWCLLSHLLIFHGRRVCKARGSDCSRDPLCRLYCSHSRQRSATP